MMKEILEIEKCNFYEVPNSNWKIILETKRLEFPPNLKLETQNHLIIKTNYYLAVGLT